MSDKDVNAIGGISWATAELAIEGCEANGEIAEALQFSACAHTGQERAAPKGAARPPFFVHPVSVAKICLRHYQEAGLTDRSVTTLVCAALLHDVLEDSRVPASAITERFGEETSRLVLSLTKPRLLRGESPHTRMARFAEQIVSGGPAAVFLKCCDLMDNIADPSTDPPDVFERAVARAREYYLPLLDSVTLSSAFSSRVRSAVKTAEDTIRDRVILADTERGQTRFRKILLEASAPKTESHDLVRLLREVLGCRKIAVAQFPRHGRPAIIAGAIGVPLDAGRLLTLRQLAARRGGFTRLGPQFFRTSSASAPISTTYLVCSDQGFDAGDTLIIAEVPDGWTSPFADEMATEAVTRLIVSVVVRNASGLYRDLAHEALSLGLEVDLALALEVGVQRGQLAQLVMWQRRCELACRLIENALQVFLEKEKRDGPLWHRVRIEHRVKSCASILRKFATNKHCRWPDFATVEDLAGVRAVCPSTFHVEKIASFIATQPSISERSSDIRRYDREPTKDGYRGVHAILAVRLAGVEVTVPCELQLRSALQDAWSHISHTMTYKKERTSKHRLGEAFRRLATDLAEADNRITELLRELSV